MRGLAEVSFDLKVAGFDQKEIDLVINDPGEMNFDAVSDDIEGDLETQKADGEAKLAATDAREVPVHKALATAPSHESNLDGSRD